MHGSSQSRPDSRDEQLFYTPEAARFTDLRENTLYKWRLKTKQTGVQHGPVFQIDAAGRPYYTRGALLDFRRQAAIARAKKARQRR